MLGIESIYCDDLEKKTAGVEIPIPGLEGAFMTVSAFDEVAFNEAIRKKKYLFEDPDNPTPQESRKVVSAVYVELFIKSWRGVYLNGKELDNTEAERKRILTDEKFERLLNVAIHEMNKISNFQYKEKEKAKKP